MLKSKTRPRPPLLPGEEPPYEPCGRCSRCVSGTGRDRDPDATDCYDDMLTAAAQPTRRPA